MGSTDNRTLAVYAKFFDNVTSGFKGLGAAAKQVGKDIIAPFQGVASAITSTRGIISSLIAFLAVRRGVQFFEGLSEGLDRIAKLSDNLGVSVESLTAVRNQAELAGVSMEDLGQALKFFEKNVSAAAEGSKKQEHALYQLGLTADEFRGGQLDSVEVLAKVADAMANVGDTTERTRILSDLFGKSTGNLGSLLKEGGKRIREMADETRKLGGVFSRDELHQVEEFNDSITRIGQTFRTLFERVIVAIAPALTEIARILNERLVKNFGDVRRAALSFALTVVDVAESVAGAIESISNSVDNVKTAFQTVSLIAQAASHQFFEFFGSTTKGAEKADEALVAQRQRWEEIRQAIRASLQDLDKQPLRTPKIDTAPATGFFHDLGEGIDKANESLLDFSKTTKEAGQQLVAGPLGAFQNSLAGLISHTQNLKQAWLSFGNSTIQVLSQIIAKLITVKIIESAISVFSGGVGAGAAAAPSGGGPFGGFGFAKGGVFRGGEVRPLPFRAMAAGGITDGPTLLLAGEGRHRAEAFVPLPDGKNIPVELRDRGGLGGDLHLHFNINAIDTQSGAQFIYANRKPIAEAVAAEVSKRVALRQSLQRSGR